MWFRRNGRSASAALKSWYGTLSKARQMALIVVALHIAILIASICDHALGSRPKPRRPIAIRTALPPSKTPSSPAPKQNKPNIGSKATPQKTASPTAKKAPAPVKITKTTTVKEPAPMPKKAPASTSPSQNLPIPTSLPEKTPTLTSPSQNLPIPTLLTSLSSAATLETELSSSSDTPTYGPMLGIALQEQLQLPELGEVIARLILQPPGILSEIEIIDTKSKANAEFLKKRLPLLELPCFNDYGIKDKTLEFTITFRNVETP